MTRAREAARLIGNNTFRLDSNNAVGFNSTTPDAMFDINHGLTVAGVSTFTGNVTMSGDLTVQGTTTTLDTIVQEVDLMNIQANSSTPGLGVTQSGSGDIAKFYDGTSAVFTIADGGGVTVESGVLTLNNNLDMQDSDKILLGTGDDIEIYHNGTNGRITNSDGSFFVGGSRVKLTNAAVTEVYVDCLENGRVDLMYDASVKLTTKSDGVDITGELQCDSLDVDGDADITGTTTLHGNLDLQDNDKIKLGASDDLEIYHDGSNSVIKDSGTGNLTIQSNNVNIINAAGNEFLAKFIEDGAVELYHNNSKKIETTSSGVTVTGDVNSTSDINLKKDIEVVGSSTEMLNQLRGVKFTWKENEEKSVGVIAQEVEAILPELVRGEEGDKSVNYSGLVGVLIEAVKELSARVEELENK